MARTLLKIALRIYNCRSRARQSKTAPLDWREGTTADEMKIRETVCVGIALIYPVLRCPVTCNHIFIDGLVSEFATTVLNCTCMTPSDSS